MTEEETVDPDGLRVLSVKQEGDSLYVELAAKDREELVGKGRKFAMDFVGAEPKYAGWSRAGVEKSGNPVAYDPTDEDNDPYAVVPKVGTEWHYDQQVRVTRSPI